MNEDLIKQLIEAANRLAAAIESLRGPGPMGDGIHVHHHGEFGQSSCRFGQLQSGAIGGPFGGPFGGTPGQ